MKTLPQRFVKVKMAHRYVCQGNPLRRPYKVVKAVNLGGFTWLGADQANERDLNKLVTCLQSMGYRVDVRPHSMQPGFVAQFYSPVVGPYNPVPQTSAYGPDLASAVFAATDRLVNKMAEWKAGNAE